MKINKLSWAVAYKIDKKTQDDGRFWLSFYNQRGSREIQQFTSKQL